MTNDRHISKTVKRSCTNFLKLAAIKAAYLGYKPLTAVYRMTTKSKKLENILKKNKKNK